MATWLLNNHFDSVESCTARIIFGHLNWGFNGEDELFLSHDIHFSMAYLVCDVYIKRVGEIMGSGVSESLRTVRMLKLINDIRRH